MAKTYVDLIAVNDAKYFKVGEIIETQGKITRIVAIRPSQVALFGYVCVDSQELCLFGRLYHWIKSEIKRLINVILIPWDAIMDYYERKHR